jgi:hypothetical protein
LARERAGGAASLAGVKSDALREPGRCKGCGAPLPQQERPGIKRLWCSEPCRKRGYDPKTGRRLEARRSG